MAESSTDKRIGRITTEKSSTTIVWTIRNYFSLSHEKGSHYYSPSFFSLNAKWYLEICPNGESKTTSVGWIGLYLRKQHSARKEHLINYTLGIRNGDGSVYDSWSDKCRFQGNEIGYGIRNFARRSKIKEKSSTIAPNNSLTVFCVINDKDHEWDSTSETAETNSIQLVEELLNLHQLDLAESVSGSSRNEDDEFDDRKQILPNKTGLDIFSRNLKDLLLSERFCDFKIRIDGQEFRVHKAILAAHSPVFSAMFENEMAEKNNGVVEISDSNPDVFKEFLHYLYTGKIEEVSLTHVCGVYMLSDKYDVKQLKEECIAIMNSGLSVDIFCDVMSLAVKYEESELLKTATDYFVKNATSILQTVKWQSFIAEAPTVANELFLKTMIKGVSRVWQA